MSSLEKAIWNWMDTYPQEFADLQKQPNEDLSKTCEELFDILDTFVDKKSRAAAVWPLQMMLLMLSPKVLEEIVNADFGPPGSPRYSKKKQFIDNVKRSLRMHGSSSSRQLSEAAAVACVKLTKAATYINNVESRSNVILILVQQMMDDLISLLFHPTKPFSRGQNYNAQDIDLMIDSFVSSFRINPHNNEVFKFCLNVNYGLTYQFVLVSSLYKQVQENIFLFTVSRFSASLIGSIMSIFQNLHAAKIAVVARDQSRVFLWHGTQEHVH